MKHIPIFWAFLWLTTTARSPLASANLMSTMNSMGSPNPVLQQAEAIPDDTYNDVMDMSRAVGNMENSLQSSGPMDLSSMFGGAMGQKKNAMANTNDLLPGMGLSKFQKEADQVLENARFEI